MPRFKPKGTLDRSAVQDLWRHTLSRIPTAYGRLSHLASLRDPNSGIYRHHGLSVAFGRDESSKALKLSHEEAFAEWLNLPMAQRYADVMAYLASLEDPAEVVLGHWLRSKIYRVQAPSPARRMERELFFRDMEALLQTIKNGLDAAAKGPTSSPPASLDR